jgi:cob(I)alamin adenosyltransferase
MTFKIYTRKGDDGKTGLINKVEELLENQQHIKVDVEVMKAKG